MKVGLRSLRWRLMSAVLLVHLLVFGVLIWMAQQSLTEYTEAQVLRRARMLEVELTAALSSPIIERDYVTLAEIVRELVSVAEVAYLVVEDAGGHVLAEASAPATQGQSTATVRDFTMRIGASRVRMGLDMASATQAWREFGRAGAAWAALAALAAAGLIGVAAFRLTWRIKRLASVADKLARGDLLARAPVRADGDELDRLGCAFNAMACELSERIQSLEQARHQTADALNEVKAERARMVALIEAMSTGVLFVDRLDRVLHLNESLRRMWMIAAHPPVIGQRATDLLARSGGRLAQPDHFSRLVLHVPGTQEVSDSTELVMNDGRVIVQACRPVRDSEGRLLGRLWLYEDVTQERRNAEQLIYLAERDGLTGLYNRRRFDEMLERALLDARRRQSRCALLLFDLDEFKHLNDHFGHRAGDALLVRVANELSTVVRRNEVLARLGGDEFALLVQDLERIEEAENLAERVVRAVARLPFAFDGRSLRITASLGIAVFPDHADSLAELVAAADMAMYHAKSAGKNGWRLYDGQTDPSAVERLGWSERIERALAEDLFELHFQGIHGPDGRLLHVEALLRMHDPESGQLVSPQHFIAPAEKTGRIVEIDRWVVQAAARTLARYPALPGVAVNLSGRTLAEVRFTAFVLDTLERHGVAPQRMLLEVTETTAISDMHDANRLLEVMRPAGCRVCLDDFGAGFSSFAYLKHLPADVIKIDGLFVRNVVNSREDRLLVQAIVSVAHGLGKSTIAEFVEDEATVRVLSELGVEAFQGYHFSKPTPELASLLAPSDLPGSGLRSAVASAV